MSEIIFAGSLGALVAITFVTLEIVLLPLFEYARKSLTIAVVRNRLAQGKKVKICPERPTATALGLSDGLSGHSSFNIVPRALKVFFKVSLLVSVFIWELQLDTVDRAQMISFHFNNKGPSGPRNESSVMFPIPILGWPEISPPFNLTQGMENKNNYTSGRVRGIDLDFAARCAFEGEGGRRSVFLGIYTRDKHGNRRIYCLNGTDSREKAEILTYNQNPKGIVRSNVTNIMLPRILSTVDNDTLLYSAKVTVPVEEALNGIHHGFIRIARNSFYGEWSAYGLVLNSNTGTIMKLIHQPSDGDEMICRNKEMPIIYTDYRCLQDYSHLHNFSLEFSGKGQAHVEDIDLRLKENSLFRVGSPLNVMRAWIEESEVRDNYANFASELWYFMQRDLFFFSVPEKTRLSLRLGVPKKHVRMRKWSTVILLVLLTLFFTYSTTSLYMRYRSRICTGIHSECVTRTALMELLRQEVELRGKPVVHDSANSVTIGCANVGSVNKRLRQISVDMGEET